LVKNEQRKILTNISWNIFVELHDGGADHQELEQQVSAHPRLWIRRGRDRGFIMLDLSDYVVSGMHDNLELLEHN